MLAHQVALKIFLKLSNWNNCYVSLVAFCYFLFRIGWSKIGFATFQIIKTIKTERIFNRKLSTFLLTWFYFQYWNWKFNSVGIGRMSVLCFQRKISLTALSSILLKIKLLIEPGKDNNYFIFGGRYLFRP